MFECGGGFSLFPGTVVVFLRTRSWDCVTTPFSSCPLSVTAVERPSMPGCPCSLPGNNVSPEDDGKGFDGPPDSRRCTDVLCLLVFILFCGAGAGIGVFAIQNGNPNSLIYGRDEFGNVCGSTNSERASKCGVKK